MSSDEFNETIFSRLLLVEPIKLWVMELLRIASVRAHILLQDDSSVRDYDGVFLNVSLEKIYWIHDPGRKMQASEVSSPVFENMLKEIFSLMRTVVEKIEGKHISSSVKDINYTSQNQYHLYML